MVSYGASRGDHAEPDIGSRCQNLRGVAKYRNNRLTKGVKIKELKKKPQNPIRRFRPAIPAARQSARYTTASSRTIDV
jgi:hypothetical protein